MNAEVSLLFTGLIFSLGLSFYLALRLVRVKDDLDVEKAKHAVTLMYLERAQAQKAVRK